MTPRRNLPVAPWLLAAPAVVLFLAFFLGPLLLLVRASFFESAAGGAGFYRPGTWSTHAYAELLGERFGRGVITFTVALGVGVAALSVLIGYPLALFIHSLPRRAKAVALGVVILPKLANVFVVLYGVNLLLGHAGPVNRTLVWLGATSEPLLLTHNLVGVVIAETYLIMPYAVLVLVPALDRIDPSLTAAARGLGAGPWAAFRRVTLPLVAPSVLAGAVVSLILSANEFTLSVFLSTPRTKTLPAALWPEARDKETPLLAAASCLTVLVTLVGMLVAARLMRREEWRTAPRERAE